MWMMVLFDLPVITKDERKAATDFRNFLLNEGFEMSQFSVYLRFVGERDRVPAYVRRVSEAVPEQGRVSMLFFTDRQFEETIFYENRRVLSTPKTPEQLLLI